MNSSLDDTPAINSNQSEPTFITKLLDEMKNQFMSEGKTTSKGGKLRKMKVKNDMKEEVTIDDTVLTEPIYPVESDSIKTETSTNDIDETETKPKIKVEDADDQSPTKKSLRRKSLEEKNCILKRSSRRRSKESSESVLQSAIARKEKSFNVPNKPLRSTRQLKPTQKILENLAYAKLEKARGDKQIDGQDNGKRSKVRKRPSRDSKSSIKKQKVNEIVESEDSEVDVADGGELRKSLRLSSHSKEDLTADSPDEPKLSLDVKITTTELSSVGAELIASRLCLCTKKTDYFVNENEKGDPNFCSAVDNIDGKMVGCSRLSDLESPLMRPSSRVPYISMCELHKQRMLRHNCCPTCGIFCTQGDFVECDSKHQYHRNCQISVGEIECCPHCGLKTAARDIHITLHSAGNPIFLKTQKVHYPPAKMSCVSVTNGASTSKCPTPPLISKYIFKPIDLDTDDQNYSFDDLFEAVKMQDADLVSVILATKSVDLSNRIEEFNNGTILHFVAHEGYLTMLHMLIIAGIDVDSLDKEQNSPLMVAIAEEKNEVVEYLIKAGASVTLKGMDGMTPLHIAAKSGNLKACDLILKAASVISNFVNVQDDGGWTALVWACEHNFLELVEYIITKGANVRICDVEYNNALHWSAFSGNSSILELLLNQGIDINAVNVHGDTPLHIAARENMYNTVIILLSRGASVSVINKNNETPLDCVSEGSECYDLIALNIKLRVLTEADFKRHKYILTNDISNGKESNPIQCINMIDEEPYPSDFTYITRNCVTSKAVQIDARISNLQCCSCEDRCIGFTCNCFKLSKQPEGTEGDVIYECNDKCRCNYITCSKRIVQKGTTQRFQIFKSFMKGWGIRSLNFIPKGSFVCEYLGEMLTGKEADVRDDDSYIFDLDSKQDEAFCIDAKYYGNLSRFINHSCDSNLTPVKVYAEHQDLRFPRIAMFATKDILANEELSFDYGEKFWLVKYKSFTCQCGTSRCKYSEEKINQIVELYNNKIIECNYEVE